MPAANTARPEIAEHDLASFALGVSGTRGAAWAELSESGAHDDAATLAYLAATEV
jgi:hypothetical protein